MLSALNLRMPTGHLYDRRHLSLRGIDLQHIYGDHGSLRGVCQHRVTRGCGLLNLNVHMVSTVSKHPSNIVRDIMPKVLHELLPLHVRFQTTYAPCTEITRQMRQSSIAHDRSPSLSHHGGVPLERQPSFTTQVFVNAIPICGALRRYSERTML